MNKFILSGLISTLLLLGGCVPKNITQTIPSANVPATFSQATDSISSAETSWRKFINDPYLIRIIDTALSHNQALFIAQSEIEIAKNDIRLRNGQLFPTVEAKAGRGLEKVGRYTSQGAGDASADIISGKRVPEWLGNMQPAFTATWQADIWGKLHNAKKSALKRYLATIDGRNFLVTNLISEIAGSYYELLSLDAELKIIRQTIQLQKNSLEIGKAQKEAAVTNELAVKKLESEVSGSQSLEYELLQKIQTTENEINFLAGRYPQQISRDTSDILSRPIPMMQAGIPAKLLINRPDIHRAEMELEATKLDVKVARAEFFPSLNISSDLGLQAFNPAYLIKLPESLLFTLAGDIALPFINRSAIKAEYSNANARQLQALYNYQRTVLNAYIEVNNQLSNLKNLQQQYFYKSKQVTSQTESVDIAHELFKSAHADYLEVLITQRDALDSKMDLVETKQQLLTATINMYEALGGGWKP